MISDENLRARLEGVGIGSSPAPATSGVSSKQARRGTPEFDHLMDKLEDEWELDEEELDNIVEIRLAGDSFEIRLKGEDQWELLEDDEEQDSDDEDSDPSEDEGFGEEE